MSCSWLEFNVPFQHKYGYIRDEPALVNSLSTSTSTSCAGGTERNRLTPVHLEKRLDESEYLDGVEAADNASVLDVDVRRRVRVAALGLRPSAALTRELPADLLSLIHI